MKKIIFGALLLIIASNAVQAANINTMVLPNKHGKSLTTPVAWGASNGIVFMGIGGTSSAPYSDDNDGGMAIGVGIGNPIKNVGFQASISTLDLSDWKRIGLNMHLHHYLGKASSVAIGVENIMIEGADLTDSKESYYVVFSKGVDTESLINQNTRRAKLHYSIGVGNGRFSEKSPEDISDGKGKDGTSVFGNISYELFEEFNAICDWNGVNLNAGISKTFSIGKRIPLVVTVGLADLTDNSGDGVRIIGGLGTGFKL